MFTEKRNQLIIILLLSFTGSESAPIILDKTLAQVNDTIITLSNVALFFQLEQMLNENLSKPSLISKKLPFPMNKRDLITYTEKLITIELLYQEASKLNPDMTLISQKCDDFVHRFHKKDFENITQQLNTKKKTLLTLLRKKLIAENFTITKINIKNLIVNDNEVDDYLKQHHLSSSKKSKAAIIQILKNKKKMERLSDFIKKLLERNHVKHISNDF